MWEKKPVEYMNEGKLHAFKLKQGAVINKSLQSNF